MNNTSEKHGQNKSTKMLSGKNSEGPKGRNQGTSTTTIPRQQQKNFSQTSWSQLDFNSPYPKSWNTLIIADFFNLLNRKKPLNPQLVIDWCKRMQSILTDERLKKNVNQITIARGITSLGKEARNPKIRNALHDYFKNHPQF